MTKWAWNIVQLSAARSYGDMVILIEGRSHPHTVFTKKIFEGEGHVFWNDVWVGCGALLVM